MREFYKILETIKNYVVGEPTAVTLAISAALGILLGLTICRAWGFI